jgi:hypothetical protein
MLMFTPRPPEGSLGRAVIAIAARVRGVLDDDGGAAIADYALVTAMFAMACLAVLGAIGYVAGASPSPAESRLTWLGVTP